MLHHSKLGESARHFPQDRQGHIPDHRDHWSHMDFDHGEHDPEEPGISEEERARRVEYLDTVWWPKIIAQVNQQKKNVVDLPHDTFIRKWSQEVMEQPPEQEGFEPA
ncbi:MAG: hypothetical protein RIC55_35405 [Pirellulaceae bacterium]